MSMDLDALRARLVGEEGQYFERKSLFEGPAAQKQPRDRRTVREEIAKHVAGFANADGGLLVMGVEDDGTLTGHAYPDDAVDEMLRAPCGRLNPPGAAGTRVAMDGHELLLFDVVPAARAVMVVGDGYPRREGDEVVLGSEEAINQMKDAGLVASPEARAARNAGLRDLDLALVDRAIKAAGFVGDRDEYLVQRRLADRRGAELVLRTGAVWLFAAAPGSIEHPNLGVRIWRVHGTEQRLGQERNVQDFPRIDGNLVRVLELARERIASLVRSSSKLHDLFFRETPEYPPFAWQEGLVNALAHRDYSVESRCAEIWLYEDRMEIVSPGGLVAGVTLEDLRERRRVHASRNPRLARVLTELGVMREQGEGIPRIFDEMEQSWLRPPGLDADERSFRLVLQNQPILDTPDPDWVRRVQALPVSQRQQRALVAYPRGGFASADYQALNGTDRDVAYRELRELVDLGLVETTGHGRGARWVVRSDAVLEATVPLTPKRVLALRMESKGAVQNADYQDAFAVDRRQALVALQELVAEGVLVREGEKRGSRYRAGPSWKGWVAGA